MTDELKPFDANDGENKPYQPPEEQPADSSEMFTPPPMDATPPPMDYPPPSAEPLDWQSASAFEGAEPVEPIDAVFNPPPVEPTPVHTPEPAFIPPPISSGPAYTPPPSIKRNGTKWWVIVIIVLVVLCFCCAVVGGLAYFFGDQIVETYSDYSWLIGSLVL